jgi:hypothetical protein
MTLPEMLVTSRRYVTNVLCRRRNRTVVAVAVVIFLLVVASAWNSFRDDVVADRFPVAGDDFDWDAEYEKARRESLREHMSFYVGQAAATGRLQPVPESWTARDRCPACFGTDMCRAVYRRELLVDLGRAADESNGTGTAANRKGVYMGRWLDVPVVVKRLANWYPKEFELFDEFVCRNATGQKECNISTAITDSQCFVQKPEALTPESLFNAWKISYNSTGPLALTYALCLTPDIVKEFSRLYTIASEMSPDERAMLYTSMVVQPESLMLKFLKEAHSDRLAPRVYGACGRLVVVEHGGRLLETYLNASFSERAELALQLISLMKMLWHADQKWFAVYNDVQYENIAVSHYGQVYFVDYEHLSIIQNIKPETEKAAADDGIHESDDNFHDDGHQLDEPVLCNDDCFERLFVNLSDERLSPDARQALCRALHDISLSFMYSALCRNILLGANSTDDVQLSPRGLLHSIPNDDDMSNRRQKAEEALKECAHETRLGGRLDAVDSLSEILSVYTGLRLE